MLKQRITKPYYHKITISKAGLVAIFIAARCKSRKQIRSNIDEGLRVEINGLQCREIPPEKNVQLFNIPSTFNGSKLKGLTKTVVFLTVLTKGEHIISLIPRKSAFVEKIQVQELTGKQSVTLNIEEQAEDGNNRPWYTFALIDLPLSQISADITVTKRLWDSDDVKIIVDGAIKKNIQGGKYKYWYLVGGILGWVVWRVKGERKKINLVFDESLDSGIHYIELHVDRKPVLHQIKFNLTYTETNSEIRASALIKTNSSLVKQAAKKFNVDPVIVGAVIYQEQSTNVNFIDTLADYIGGILHLNTSIGIGQVRVNTAEQLEEHYPQLDPHRKDRTFIDYNAVRVERLKDPLTNIQYVAAKIHFSQDRWQKAGFKIKDKPEILGTLYNIEDISKPIEPHSSPETNEFGKGVKRNYDKVKELLEL